jgi:hypothetical protein
VLAEKSDCWTGRVPNQITIEPLFFILYSYIDAITVCVTKSVAVVVKVFILDYLYSISFSFSTLKSLDRYLGMAWGEDLSR